MFYSDVKLATKNKVPLVRSSCLTWVATCIETSNKPTVLKLHKEYIPILMEVFISMSPALNVIWLYFHISIYFQLAHICNCACVCIYFGSSCPFSLIPRTSWKTVLE